MESAAEGFTRLGTGWQIPNQSGRLGGEGSGEGGEAPHPGNGDPPNFTKSYGFCRFSTGKALFHRVVVGFD